MHPDIPNLPATTNDVQALAEILTNPFCCCYLHNIVQFLTNEQATSENIRKALKELAQVVSEDSTVVIYFSGHGGRIYESDTQNVYLFSHDTNPNYLERTAVSGSEFDELLAAIYARKLLIILDACHASGAAKLRLSTAHWRQGLPDAYVQELAQGNGRVVIASSKENQVSWNRPGNDHGLFTWHLLEGLKGEATQLDKFIRVFDLYDYVNKQVRGERPDQEPVLHAKNVDANFPIALNSNSATMKILSKQMRAWFEALKYEFERHDIRTDNYFEWIIKVPIGRRRHKYVLVRGIEGEIGVRDVTAIREAVVAQDADEGWVVTTRRVSSSARNAVENSNLFCYTFDELLDEDADFDGYLDWLEAEVKRRGIDKMYIPLACTKEEFDAAMEKVIGKSVYDEQNGWIDGYVNRWLADSTKMHISVLGEFGTGKTWFALHYAWQALLRYREAKAAGIERPRLPLVISLRDYSKALNIEFLFSDFFFRKHEIPLRDYSAFDQLNRMGKLLLIFDGFDEMADKVDRQKMINNFWELARVAVPESKIILTCRTEHFPEAQEGRALLNAELKASTANLTGEPPQFEVVYLKHFNDAQIERALSLRADSVTVERVMNNQQLLDLAQRPLMTELILEALPDIKKGKPIDLSRIYLYAVRQKMERDIKNERTFTSLADKLYFLCELSWEMLSTDKMALNYRLFPDRIRGLFGPAVQEQKDLDHWYYDMMGQTMLIPNADGDYAPAHRSLLEFFVAYKFVAELGILAPDFTEIACTQSYIDTVVPPQDYTWSSYFHRDISEEGKVKLIPPLNTFVSESLNNLFETLGKQKITKAVLDFMTNMLLPDKKELKKRLLLSIKATVGETVEDIGIIAGNIATLITYYDRKALRGVNLSGSNLYKADFGIRTRGGFHFEAKPVDLSNANLEGTNLQDVDFSKVVLVNANLSHSSLYGVKGLPSVGDHFFDKVALAPDSSFLVAGGIEGIVKLWWLETGKEQIVTEKMSWIGCLAISSDKRLVAAGDNMGCIIIYDIQKSQIMHQIRDHKDCIASLVFDPDKNCLIVASGGNPPKDNSLRIYTIADGKLSWHYQHSESFKRIAYYPSSNTLLTLDWGGGIDLWDIEKKLHIRNLINRVYGKQNQINEKKVNHFSISADCQQMLVVRDSGREFALQILEVPELGTIWKREKFPLYITPPEPPLPPYQAPPGMDHSFMLSNQGHLIAFSVDNVFVLWNVLEDREIWHSNEHLHWIENIIFSQDDKYIVTGCRDDTIKIWDVENGKTVRTISTSRNYIGLRLTGSRGLNAEALKALEERGAIVE